MEHRSLLSRTFCSSPATWTSRKHLIAAAAISPSTPQIAEDFARIHVAHKDDKAPCPILNSRCAADVKRQDLWFLQAQAGERLGDAPLAIHSFEQGLALGGVHISETTSLIRLDVAAKQTGKAANSPAASSPNCRPTPSFARNSRKLGYLAATG